MTTQKTVLKIATDYSRTPGPRTSQEGDHSAEKFLADILLSRFEQAVSSNSVLLVDLDGGYGYATSFLEEAFGGLARIKGVELTLRHIEIKSDEEPYLVADVTKYIREAKTGKRR